LNAGAVKPGAEPQVATTGPDKLKGGLEKERQAALLAELQATRDAAEHALARSWLVCS